MKVSHEYLPTDDVEYDPDNPRISSLLEGFANIDHDFIGQALSPGDSKFLELKQAIKSSGGLINPIIVNKKDDKFIAVEGNTRLAIYKQFHKEKPEDESWAKIPSLVYEGMEKRGIDAIRLQAHMVGVRNWAPYDKAKYLYTLHENDRFPAEALIDFCGGNKLEVLRNISAYKQMEFDYRPAVPNDESYKQKFSLFYEAQKPKIRQSITQAGFTEKDFIGWVAKNKFAPRQELIRQLPKILKSPRAREVFLTDGANTAVRYIDRPAIAKELLEASLVELCNALETKLKILERQELREIRKDEDSVQSVEDCLIAIQSFIEEEIKQE